LACRKAARKLADDQFVPSSTKPFQSFVAAHPNIGDISRGEKFVTCRLAKNWSLGKNDKTNFLFCRPSIDVIVSSGIASPPIR
jgi:hypothetical protein